MLERQREILGQIEFTVRLNLTPLNVPLGNVELHRGLTWHCHCGREGLAEADTLPGRAPANVGTRLPSPQCAPRPSFTALRLLERGRTGPAVPRQIYWPFPVQFLQLSAAQKSLSYPERASSYHGFHGPLPKCVNGQVSGQDRPPHHGVLSSMPKYHGGRGCNSFAVSPLLLMMTFRGGHTACHQDTEAERTRGLPESHGE